MARGTPDPQSQRQPRGGLPPTARAGHSRSGTGMLGSEVPRAEGGSLSATYRSSGVSTWKVRSMTVVHCRQRMMKVLGRGRSVFISWHSGGGPAGERQVSAACSCPSSTRPPWKAPPIRPPCSCFPPCEVAGTLCCPSPGPAASLCAPTVCQAMHTPGARTPGACTQPDHTHLDHAHQGHTQLERTHLGHAHTWDRHTPGDAPPGSHTPRAYIPDACAHLGHAHTWDTHTAGDAPPGSHIPGAHTWITHLNHTHLDHTPAAEGLWGCTRR